MTLAQLRYFLAIVDAGLNITLAAERVNATQPGLSKQLRQLEDELGVQLFVRRGRALDRLTPAGDEVAERARIILAEATNIRTFTANQRGDVGGTLLIETTHIQAQFVLPLALARLRDLYPDLSVELTFSADTNEPSRFDPDADVSLFSTDGSVPLGDVAIALFSWDPVAVVPRGHPLASRTDPLRLNDLARYPLITYDTSRTAPLSLARTFLEAGLTPSFAFTLRDAEVIKAMKRRGLGIGLLAEMGVDPEIDADLAILPVAGLFRRCTTWAQLRRDRVLRDPLVELLSQLSGLAPVAIRRQASGDHPLAPDRLLPTWPERSAQLVLDASNCTRLFRSSRSARA